VKTVGCDITGYLLLNVAWVLCKVQHTVCFF